MKLPFTYQNSFFGTAVIASVVLHGFMFTQVGFQHPSPDFSVEQSPASMEVVLVEQKVPEQKKITENVFAAREINPKMPKVIQKEVKPEEQLKSKIEKTVSIPPVNGAVTEAKPAYLKNPAPRYPFRARQNSWEGVVTVKIHVEKDGRPSETLVSQSSGYRVLDDEAVQTIKKWSFSPARSGNLALDSWIEIPVRFVLNDHD